MVDETAGITCEWGDKTMKMLQNLFLSEEKLAQREGE
jgi:hypothetical protein